MFKREYINLRVLLGVLAAGSFSLLQVVDHGGSYPLAIISIIGFSAFFIPGKKEWVRNQKILAWVVCFFVLHSFLSLVFTGITDPGERLLGRHALLLHFILLLSAFIRFGFPSWAIPAGLCIGSVLNLLYGGYQHYFLDMPRSIGSNNAIQFGTINMLYCFVLAVYAYKDSRPLLVGIYLLCAAAAFWAAALSGTRGALLGGIGSGLFIFVASLKYFGGIRIRALLGFVVMLSLSSVATYSLMGGRLATAEQEIDSYFSTGHKKSSLGYRFEMWKASYELIKQSPVFGVGLGNYKSKLQELSADDDIVKRISRYKHPHNEYIAFWVYGGFVGFCILIGLFFSFFAVFWRELERSPVYACIGGGAIVLYAFFSLSNSVFDRGVSIYPFVLMLAFVVYSIYEVGGDERG